MAHSYRRFIKDLTGERANAYYDGFVAGAEWMESKIIDTELESNSGRDFDTTIVLPSMPEIEWATKNLSGYRCLELNGECYYTWEQAVCASLAVGGGWRLPTYREIKRLTELETSHHGDYRYFEGLLQLEATGLWLSTSPDLIDKGSSGSYWSYTPVRGEDRTHFALTFMKDRVIVDSTRDNYFCSVRLVRDL